jgi:hypothetical protein
MGERGAGRTPPEIRLIEQSEDVVHLVCSARGISYEVVANIALEGTTLVLSRLHVDGPGPNRAGIGLLRQGARALAQQYGVELIEIRGGERRTGANPGHMPRTIRIKA